MSFKEKLSKYAKLIVKSGLNVQTDQIVVIDAPVESVELVRLITKEAYEVGAKEVVFNYNFFCTNFISFFCNQTH